MRLVDDYYSEPDPQFVDEVYRDLFADYERQSAEQGDRLLLIFEADNTLAVYNPETMCVVGSLSSEVRELVGHYRNDDLDIRVTDRDDDYEHKCVRYGVQISVVRGGEL